jgi:hypothetical protein
MIISENQSPPQPPLSGIGATHCLVAATADLVQRRYK